MICNAHSIEMIYNTMLKQHIYPRNSFCYFFFKDVQAFFLKKKKVLIRHKNKSNFKYLCFKLFVNVFVLKRKNKMNKEKMLLAIPNMKRTIMTIFPRN
jgi:hypothetical protein